MSCRIHLEPQRGIQPDSHTAVSESESLNDKWLECLRYLRARVRGGGRKFMEAER